MSVAGNLSPLLFLTFKSLYGISYSLLGLLVLINFITQLGIDLIFSFFSHKFNIEKTVRTMPIISAVGLVIYAIIPPLFPSMAYLAIAIGTVIMSVSAGLGEVLISPVIATIPSDDPDREMSKLHSVYAWGVVCVVIFSTLFLFFVGEKLWWLLALMLTLIPISSAILFSGAKIPKMETPERVSGAFGLLRNPGIWLCVMTIFFGGAAECTMAQWCSGYLEAALGIEKLWGDIFGVALFALTLGLGRTLYSKIGKNIHRALILGFLGSAICYLLAATVEIPFIGLLACAFTGFCVSMLWPGNLVVAASRFPTGGVFIYALMAAGGDLGASVGPQLIGIITDLSVASPELSEFALGLGITAEQLGMKMGMLIGTLMSLLGFILAIAIRKSKSKEADTKQP